MRTHDCMALLGIALEHWRVYRHPAASYCPRSHCPMYEPLAAMLVQRMHTGRDAADQHKLRWCGPDSAPASIISPDSARPEVLVLLSITTRGGWIAEAQVMVSSASCGLARR
jgi:hypothetical protein